MSDKCSMYADLDTGKEPDLLFNKTERGLVARDEDGANIGTGDLVQVNIS